MVRDSFSVWSSMPSSPPSEAPVVSHSMRRGEQWRSYENSVSAVSFCFAATAILISMFLVMALFERFLSQRSPDSGARNRPNDEAQLREHGKPECPSAQMTVYAKGVSVLMPGEAIPTFIAHPVPVPCSPERHLKALHQHNRLPGPSSSSTPRHPLRDGRRRVD